MNQQLKNYIDRECAKGEIASIRCPDCKGYGYTMTFRHDKETCVKCRGKGRNKP